MRWLKILVLKHLILRIYTFSQSDDNKPSTSKRWWIKPKWLSGKMGLWIMLWTWYSQLGGLIASGKREEISVPWNLDLGYSLPNSHVKVPGPQPESNTTIPCSRASCTGESKLFPQASFIIQCCWCNLSSSGCFVNHHHPSYKEQEPTMHTFHFI